MRGRYQNSRGGLGLPVPRSEHRGLGATTNSVALPKPKPRAMREHLVVSAIGGREIAQAHRSRIPHREDALQQLDFGNGLFRVHPDQYGAQATPRSTPGRNRLAKNHDLQVRGLTCAKVPKPTGPLTMPLYDYIYGLISMGVPSGTVRQISSISSFVTAIHPSVQSRNRWPAPIHPKPLGSP